MKLALSIGGANATRETFESIKSAGISAVEISNGMKNYADMIDFHAIKKFADEFGITLWSYHLPFYNPDEQVNISKLGEVADSTVEYFCSMIDKAADVGIKTFVVHPSAEPVRDEVRAERLECAKKSLYKLAEHAKTKDAVIAVEDLPRTCLGRNSDEMLELISAHPDLRICFDTNHLLSEDISEFIRKVGKYIVTTHVSDYDFVNERHWLPGEGKIDWIRLKNDLESVGYDGYFLYEVSMSGSSWTIDRERPLAHTDVRRNYDEIMSGKAPTPFGKAKPNLPMHKPKEN